MRNFCRCSFFLKKIQKGTCFFLSNFDCANLNVKLNTSKILKLPSNLDSRGELIKSIIYSLVDLRNAIAHNGVLFDIRFQTGNVNKLVKQCLEQETNIKNIDFRNIVDYIILILYILIKMKESKTSCNKFINDFIKNAEFLKKNVPSNLYSQIFSTQLYNKTNQLKDFVKKK